MRARGIAVDERLEEGDPPEVISSVSEEVGARMIALGSHGRRGLARLLLGSVVHQTLLRTDRPVLVARSGPAPAAFDEWAAGGRPLRVLAAVDRSPASAALAAWVRWLRTIGPVDLRMMFVYEPLIEAYRLFLRGGEDRPAEVERSLERELRASIGDFPDPGAVSLTLRASTERPAEVVAQEADATRADLLVLGTHQRTPAQRIWLGSTAELALRAARVPVLCVPAASRAALEETGRANEIG
jgi:nucleotide-binding universal stress UspA family protein